MAFNPAEHFMDLKGREYLQVQWRLVWFREKHPYWAITTEMVDHDRQAQSAVFRATILDESGSIKQTAYGSESAKDFRDYLEKAETKAVGRALAMIGFGTQFAGDELDEGERIVDSPVRRSPQKPAQRPQASAETAQPVTEDEAKALLDLCNEDEAGALVMKYGPKLQMMNRATFNVAMERKHGRPTA